MVVLCWFYWILWDLMDGYPLVMTDIAMEVTIFNGKIHYFYGNIQELYVI